MFEVAEAYERQRGRSSKLLAPLFADFAGVRGEVLDVGCGTGALTFAIAKNPAVSKIVGIDLSEGFLAYARSKCDDFKIRFERGDAQKLPYLDESFDCCLALLGAHPILAWTACHLIAADIRAQGVKTAPAGVQS